MNPLHAVSVAVCDTESTKLTTSLYCSLVLPYWWAFILYAKAIPAIPTALLSDNITFVDVLGRKTSLTYTEFRMPSLRNSIM